jgi:hypothetical protein
VLQTRIRPLGFADPDRKEAHVTELDEPAQRLVSASQHLRGADHDLRMVLTLLRQQEREVPETIADALACVEDALAILDS